MAINVAHAPPTRAARLVAALPPISLLLAVELLLILARRGLAHPSAPQAPVAAPEAQATASQAPPGAPEDGARAGDARATVAELVAQEQAGARPRLTDRSLIGVKERRAQVLLREFRTNPDEAAPRNGHRPGKGGN